MSLCQICPKCPIINGHSFLSTETIDYVEVTHTHTHSISLSNTYKHTLSYTHTRRQVEKTFLSLSLFGLTSSNIIILHVSMNNRQASEQQQYTHTREEWWTTIEKGDDSFVVVAASHSTVSIDIFNLSLSLSFSLVSSFSRTFYLFLLPYSFFINIKTAQLQKLPLHQIWNVSVLGKTRFKKDMSQTIKWWCL